MNLKRIIASLRRGWMWLLKPENRIFLFLIGLILVLLLILASLLTRPEGDEAMPTPPKTANRLFGADFSSWQEPTEIAYDLLALRLDFAILRAGYTGHDSGIALKPDNAFEAHYQNFTARKIPLGVYWYSCADTAEKGRAEALEVLRMIDGKNIEYPIFWDTEDEYYQIKVGPEQLTEAALAFCRTIEAAGYEAGIYANAYWFRDRLELDRLTDYELWLASWDQQPSRDIPYDVLQFTEEGRLAGYDGPLDLNFSTRDYRSLGH